MRLSHSAATFSRLVGLLYDAAVDPARWPAALDGVRSALRFDHAVLALHDGPGGRVQVEHAVNLAPRWYERMRRYDAHAVAAWGGMDVILGHPVGEPAVLSRLNPGGLTDPANPWAMDWAAPLGIVDQVALVLARDGGAVGCVGLGRHRDRGPVGAGDLDALRALVPHVQRAAAIGRLLDEHRDTAGRLAAVLDHLAAPVLLLAADARVLHANAAARDLLAEGVPLRVRDGRLTSSVTGVVRAITDALGHIVRGLDAGLPGAVGARHNGFGIPVRGSVSRHGDDARMFALHLLPLGGSPERSVPARGAVAALFIASPQARPGRVDDIVAALYGLTPAEARVFALIAAGHTPAEAADALGVAASTLRTHLLRVYTKLGVHRQSDLARVAAALTSTGARAPEVNVSPSGESANACGDLAGSR
ncbi:MAG TPA: helix-turn-helix transcriptional regulator [Gemmatirosa sp.]